VGSPIRVSLSGRNPRAKYELPVLRQALLESARRPRRRSLAAHCRIAHGRPPQAKLGDRIFFVAHRRAPNGDLVFVFGNDLTMLRAAEEALRHSEKMATLGTLAAGTAHELSNPAAAAGQA